MPKAIDKDYEEPKREDVLEDLPNDETFCVGQGYENEAVTTISCRKCGSKAFNVGSGSCFIAIKCVNCNWQYPLHRGWPG